MGVRGRRSRTAINTRPTCRREKVSACRRRSHLVPSAGRPPFAVIGRRPCWPKRGRQTRLRVSHECRDHRTSGRPQVSQRLCHLGEAGRATFATALRSPRRHTLVGLHQNRAGATPAPRSPQAAVAAHCRVQRYACRDAIRAAVARRPRRSADFTSAHSGSRWHLRSVAFEANAATAVDCAAGLLHDRTTVHHRKP